MDKHRFVSLEMILFLSMLLIIYMFGRIQRYALWFPKSIFAMLLGVLQHFLVAEIEFDPELFLFLMLPPMVLRSALSVPEGAVSSFQSSLVFAILGTLLSTAIIAWGASIFFSSESAWLLACILSSTDQVAGTSLLKHIRHRIPRDLYWMLQNESFINDAVSITLVHLVQYRGSWIHFGMMMSLMMGVSICFAIWLAKLMMRLEYTGPTLVVLVSMLLYSIGEFLFMSGILILFVFAFTIRSKASKTLEICDMLSDVLEDLVYLLLGASAYSFSLNDDIHLGIYIFFVTWVARVVTSFVCGAPFFQVREMCFLSMTGIRGAISVALAFSVKEQQQLQMVVFVNVLVSTIFLGSIMCLLPRYLHLQSNSI